jgi:4,5-dihydroxyphthalate decarboxylase
MSHRPLQVGTRHWDHVTALSLGDVESPLGYQHHRLDSTPDLWTDPDLDVAEISFSRYVRARAQGDDRVTAVPVFLMRGFRHRCLLVPTESPLTDPAQLAGTRIGLTGWPDSGNTWTRALLVDAGVAVTDVHWWVGPLTASAPAFDRLGDDHDSRVRVDALAPGDSLVAAMSRGDLDVVMTPFMPPGFYSGSGLRTLYPDSQAAEQAYVLERGYVPGIHVVGVKSNRLHDRRDLAQQLIDLFEEAKQVSMRRRAKLLDVLPWHDREYARTVTVFGADWLPYGWSTDAPMVAEFQRQLVVQGLLAAPVADDGLFPHQLDPTFPRLEEQSA